MNEQPTDLGHGEKMGDGAAIHRPAEDTKPRGLTMEDLTAQAIAELSEKGDEIPEWFQKAYNAN